MVEITSEILIEKLKVVHNNKYEYPLFNYTNMHMKLKIICKEHGVFEQSAHSHLKGYGCPKCKFDKLKNIFSHNKEKFIENANKVHNFEYDYHLVDYINAHAKVKIICPIHGIFEQIPNNHISKKQGCPLCSYDNKKLDYYSTLEKLKIIHNNKYDYSLNTIIESTNKLKIICSIHGEFKQKLHIHMDGHGCPKCGTNKITKTENIFIEESNLIHNNKYDYSLVDYKNAYTKVKIICPIHGEFLQTPQSHLNGSGCPICKSSKGEKIIKEFLENNNIEFETQKKFKDCKNEKSLKFDFYLLDYNTCIEFDGKQHFESVEHFGGIKAFHKQQLRDKIKTEFCKNNNINLIRIKYDENIQTILYNVIFS